jgi:hypothetical protein
MTIHYLYLNIIVKLIKETSNDQELGEKLRQLYEKQLKDIYDK